MKMLPRVLTELLIWVGASAPLHSHQEWVRDKLAPFVQRQLTAIHGQTTLIVIEYLVAVWQGQIFHPLNRDRA